MTTTDMPGSLAEALARFQADLPKISKGSKAKIPGKDGRQGYEYEYADLADVSDAVLKRIGALGLYFTAWPHHRPEDGKFGLSFTLGHVSGERQDGWWELRDNLTMQQMGGMITYARRYCLLAVTGAAPAGDDDDAASSQHVPARQEAGDAWETATPARPRQEHNGDQADQSWYRAKLAEAGKIRTEAARQAIGLEAADAARDGRCTPRQATHIQNRAEQRIRQLKNTAEPVDVENLAGRAGSETGHAEDEPGSVSPQQLTKLHTVLTGLGFGQDEREQKLVIAEIVIGRKLGGADAERSSKNLSFNEARKVIDTLSGMDRDKLIAYMAERDEAA